MHGGLACANLKMRAQEGALTPEALQRYCLEVTNAWDVKKNGPLPATWDCAPGTNVTPVLPVK